MDNSRYIEEQTLDTNVEEYQQEVPPIDNYDLDSYSELENNYSQTDEQFDDENIENQANNIDIEVESGVDSLLSYNQQQENNNTENNFLDNKSSDTLDFPQDILDDEGLSQEKEQNIDSLPEGVILKTEEKNKLSKDYFLENNKKDLMSSNRFENEFFVPLRNIMDIVEENNIDDIRSDRLLNSIDKKSQNLEGIKVISLNKLEEILEDSNQFLPEMDKLLKPDPASSVNISDTKDINDQRKRNSSTQEKEDKNTEDFNKKQNEKDGLEKPENNNQSETGKQNIGKKAGQMAESAFATTAFSFLGGLRAKNDEASSSYSREADINRVKNMNSSLSDNLREMQDYEENGGKDLKARHKIQKNLDRMSREFEDNPHVFTDKKNYSNDNEKKHIAKRMKENMSLSKKLSNEGKIDRDKANNFVEKAREMLEKIMKAFKNVFAKLTGKKSPSPS